MKPMLAPDRPTGPWGLARDLEQTIAKNIALRDAAADPAERKRLNKLLKLQRDMLHWCKTRAGYVDPAKTEGSRQQGAKPGCDA
jgi:hypothetical protein